jgi:hypothetical protein
MFSLNVNLVGLTKRLIVTLLTVILLTQSIFGLTSAQQYNSDMNLVNLIIEGNETKKISNMFLNIEGVIEVNDNATLVLENVKVRFIESEVRHSFSVNDNAVLVLLGSSIKNRIKVNNNGILKASYSKLFESVYCTLHEYNHTHGGVTGYNNSKISLDRCKVGYLWLQDNSSAQASESYVYYSFPEENNLMVKNSKIQTHREPINSLDISLVIPEFYEFRGNLSEILPGSSTYFENVSLIDGLWLQSNNSKINIRDSKIHYIDNLRDSDIQLTNVSLDLVRGYIDSNEFTLTLNECNVSQIASYNSNDTIIIEKSRIENVFLSSNKLELDIRCCTIDEFYMDDVWFNPFKARITDSTVGFFNPGLGNEEPNEYFMNNVTLLDGLSFKVGGYSPTGGIDLYGDIVFDDNFSINETTVDGYAIINRFYPVYCERSGVSLANVSLVVMNGNRSLWAGETLSDVVVEVPIRFVNIFDLVRPYNASGPSVIQVNNMTNVVRLYWSYEENEGFIELDLLSETPIVIELEDEDGLGELFVPFIVIVFLVTIIYYSKKL